MKYFYNIAFFLLLLLMITACSQEPAEIHYGGEECNYCKMMISDERFASQIVTETGKAIKFDAIECMANYTEEHKSELTSAKFWVNNFSIPGSWIEVEKAQLIKSEVITSPMGAALLAVGSAESAKEHLKKYPGKIVDWQQVVK